MIPALFRIVPAMTAAAALSACGEPTLSNYKPAPVCGEVFSEERVMPLPDSLLVIETLPALTAEQEQRLAEARAQPAAATVVVARHHHRRRRGLRPGLRQTLLLLCGQRGQRLDHQQRVGEGHHALLREHLSADRRRLVIAEGRLAAGRERGRRGHGRDDAEECRDHGNLPRRCSGCPPRTSAARVRHTGAASSTDSPHGRCRPAAGIQHDTISDSCSLRQTEQSSFKRLNRLLKNHRPLS